MPIWCCAQIIYIYDNRGGWGGRQSCKTCKGDKTNIELREREEGIPWTEMKWNSYGIRNEKWGLQYAEMKHKCTS